MPTGAVRHGVAACAAAWLQTPTGATACTCKAAASAAPRAAPTWGGSMCRRTRRPAAAMRTASSGGGSCWHSHVTCKSGMGSEQGKNNPAQLLAAALHACRDRPVPAHAHRTSGCAPQAHSAHLYLAAAADQGQGGDGALEALQAQRRVAHQQHRLRRLLRLLRRRGRRRPALRRPLRQQLLLHHAAARARRRWRAAAGLCRADAACRRGLRQHLAGQGRGAGPRVEALAVHAIVDQQAGAAKLRGQDAAHALCRRSRHGGRRAGLRQGRQGLCARGRSKAAHGPSGCPCASIPGCSPHPAAGRPPRRT